MAEDDEETGYRWLNQYEKSWYEYCICKSCHMIMIRAALDSTADTPRLMC